MNKIARILHIGNVLTAKQEDIQFIRFGGLSSVKQKGYDIKMPTYHSPPVRKGIYAFVWPYVERFLLGKQTFDNRRMRWKKDSKGNKIPDRWEDDIDAMSEWKNDKVQQEFSDMVDDDDIPQEELDKFSQENQFLIEHIRPKRFKYKGDLWHHLTVPHKAILEQKGDWILTSFNDYKKALYKEIGKMKKYKEREGIGFSYDHLEVFIEKI